MQWTWGTLSRPRGVSGRKRKADDSPPPGTDVKNVETYGFTSTYLDDLRLLDLSYHVALMWQICIKICNYVATWQIGSGYLVYTTIHHTHYSLLFVQSNFTELKRKSKCVVLKPTHTWLMLTLEFNLCCPRSEQKDCYTGSELHYGNWHRERGLQIYVSKIVIVVQYLIWQCSN
jgi:hypothetical protein